MVNYHISQAFSGAIIKTETWVPIGLALPATMALLFARDSFGHLGLPEPVHFEEDVLRLLHFLFLPLPWPCLAGP